MVKFVYLDDPKSYVSLDLYMVGSVMQIGQG